MFKRLQLLFVMLIGMVLIAACGGSTAEDTVAVAEPEGSVADESVSAVEEVVVEAVEFDPYASYDEPDLTTVGATGSPQFLNAYTDW